MDGSVTIKEADGRSVKFLPSGGGYQGPAGNFDVLTKAGAAALTTYTLTRKDQTKYKWGFVTYPTIIRLLSIVDANNNTQQLLYDALGNLVTFKDVDLTTYSFVYDGLNHLTDLSDSLAPARTVHYLCDGSGQLQKFTDANGGATQYSYDATSHLTSIVDPLVTTSITNTFDAMGRVTSTKRLTCPATTYSYNTADPAYRIVTTITDPLGNQTKHYYDASLRLVKLVNALSFTTLYTYDSNNNVTSVTNPMGAVTMFTYDARGNRTSIKDPLGHITTYTYDIVNNITSETDANGKTTLFTYAGKNLLTVKDALGNITTYSYDASGNKTAFQNARTFTTSYQYTGNRLTQVQDPLLGITTYSYDSAGRRITETQPGLNSKAMTYDGLNRLKTVTYSPAGVPGVVTFSYDANDRRTAMAETSPVRSTSFGYDLFNHITSVVLPEGTVSYGYDCNDNRISATYAGKTVLYTYDALNRVKTVNDGGKITTYSYDAANNVVNIAYPNGAAVSFVYDLASRLTRVTNSYTGSGTNPISSFVYLLDNVGNRLQVTDGSGVITIFAYDAIYRLLSATVNLKKTTFAYDAVGNRTGMTAPSVNASFVYDANDKLLSGDGTTYNYDANGNLASEAAPPAMRRSLTIGPIAWQWRWSAVSRVSFSTTDSATAINSR